MPVIKLATFLALFQASISKSENNFSQATYTYIVGIFGYLANGLLLLLHIRTNWVLTSLSIRPCIISLEPSFRIRHALIIEFQSSKSCFKNTDCIVPLLRTVHIFNQRIIEKFSLWLKWNVELLRKIDQKFEESFVIILFLSHALGLKYNKVGYFKSKQIFTWYNYKTSILNYLEQIKIS